MAQTAQFCHFRGEVRISGNRGNTLIRFRAVTLKAFVLALLAAPAHAAVPTDPEGSGVIVGALNWLQGTLLGTAATVAAVIAVAAVGFGMLTGRINWRHGAVVILGCFILFGAASIVAGIQAAAGGG
jgi:type IV secretory pathway VirB2 component (pilin)